MYLFIVTLHVFLCLFLVGIILLQPGKGGDIGAAFGGGGGGGGLFGPRGPSSLLARVTPVMAALFMVTSITLAWYSSKDNLSNADVLDEIERLEREEAEGAEAPAPAPAEPEPEVVEPAADATPEEPVAPEELEPVEEP